MPSRRRPGRRHRLGHGLLDLAHTQRALVRDAEAAIELTAAQPRRAAAIARIVQRQAQADGHLESASVAERVLGLAAKELGDLPGAQAHLEAAVGLARRGGLPAREGEARMSLSFVLALRGQTARALGEAERAAGLLSGDDVARVEAQKALILQRLGRLDEALRSYGVAADTFARLGQRAEAALVHTNRGVLHAYRGDFPAAEADLAEAQATYVELRLEVAAAEVGHNLGFVAARRGDVPAALARYDTAARDFQRLGVARPAALLDRCEALLQVRLLHEGRALAQAAVDQLEAAEMRIDLAEARLVLAQAALLAGDHAQALEVAQTARRSFVRQHRPGWAALARYAVVRAKWLGGDAAVGTREAVQTATELEAAGWAVAAADARLIAARSALARGQADKAEAELVAVGSMRRSGPVDLRARAWHAEALLRLARGKERSGLAAVRAGLRVLEQHQASLGATELRVHAKSQAAELATLGLRVALQRGRPGPVFAWAERWRASLHRMPRARPPTDPVLAAALASLRQVVGDLQEQAAAGGETAGLLRRQAALEAAVKKQARHVPGSANEQLRRPPPVASLAQALADRALVELVELDAGLHAITVVDGRAQLRSLAPTHEVSCEVARLRFSLARLASGRGSAPTIGAYTAGLETSARRLDELLLRPLLSVLGERPLVIVPTGVLHHLPWAVLPSCWGRPVTVAPSATQWLAVSGRVDQPSREGTLLVEGPDCPSAGAEVADLAALVPGATALVGEQATVATVSAALGHADLAHVVAHGTFRSDNPLFSSLRLVDGPLTVYDLELLAHVPRLLVLSACDGGLAAVAAGDELLGLASALLAFGAHHVVASVAPVPEDLTRQLMVELHRRLAASTGPASALAEAMTAVQHHLPPGDARRHALAGFTCFGAG